MAPDDSGSERITITIDSELLSWLDKRVADKTFANRSHGLAYLVRNKIRPQTSYYNIR